jgi:hypothetical protein
VTDVNPLQHTKTRFAAPYPPNAQADQDPFSALITAAGPDISSA